METKLEKWKSVLSSLEEKDEVKLEKLAEYADHYAQIESSNTNLSSTSQSLLPINLQVLSKLNNWKMTIDPIVTETCMISMKLHHDFLVSIKEHVNIGIEDIMPQIEHVLIQELISQYKDKEILVYIMIDSIQMIEEKRHVPKITIRSRIKVLR